VRTFILNDKPSQRQFIANARPARSANIPTADNDFPDPDLE
jgi:hypothetical protein